jgi:hypothetical protein
MNSKINNSVIQIEIISEGKNLSKSQKQFNKIIVSIQVPVKSKVKASCLEIPFFCIVKI